jgi:hypothetical protein
METCTSGYALTYITTLKLQLVSRKVVSLTAAKFKPLRISYAWLFLVQYHVRVHLNFHGLR